MLIIQLVDNWASSICFGIVMFKKSVHPICPLAFTVRLFQLTLRSKLVIVMFDSVNTLNGVSLTNIL